MLSKLSSNILQNRNSVTDRLYHKSSISRILNKGKQKYSNLCLVYLMTSRVFADICFHFVFDKFRFRFLGKNSSCEEILSSQRKSSFEQFEVFCYLYKHQRQDFLVFSNVFSLNLGKHRAHARHFVSVFQYPLAWE